MRGWGLALSLLIGGTLAAQSPLAQAPPAPPVAPVQQATRAPATIRAGVVIDGHGRIARDVVLSIENGKIARIGRATGTPTYDLSGMTLMPGWIDTHVHIGWHFGKDGRFDNRGETPGEQALYGAENAYQTLINGFTTVQSVGSPSDVELKNAILRGILPGPRILTSIRQINERTGGTNRQLATPDQLRDAVRGAADQGADLIKLFA